MKAAFALSTFVFQFALFVFGVWLGQFCVNYVFLHTLHHTIPTIWAIVVALVTWGIPVPAAIVVKVLILLGIIAG